MQLEISIKIFRPDKSLANPFTLRSLLVSKFAPEFISLAGENILHSRILSISGTKMGTCSQWQVYLCCFSVCDSFHAMPCHCSSTPFFTRKNSRSTGACSHEMTEQVLAHAIS